MTTDEKLKRAVSAARAVLLTGTAIWAGAAAAQPAIAPRVAGLYVGQERVVEGKVVSAQREGNTVRLRFGTGPNDFVVTLSIGLLSDFPEKPEEAYAGKTVRVAGTIKSFRGVPEIGLRDASNIEIVNPRTASERTEPAPALMAPRAEVAAAVPTPRQSELEALRTQIEALTRRVEALERNRGSNRTNPE